MNVIKGIFNAIANPRVYFILMVLTLVAVVWKREKVASNAVGYGALGIFTLFFALGLAWWYHRSDRRLRERLAGTRAVPFVDPSEARS